MGRQEAQQRADRVRAFKAELAELEQEGALALTSEQRQQLERHLETLLQGLRERFDVDTTTSLRQISWGMRVAVTLGGIALCIAVFLFFYRYWGALSTPAQILLLIAAPLAALVVTHLLARRERALYFAALAAMIAVACFVLNLHALGSIFNIAPTPNAFAAWSVFALALAYQYGLRLLLAVGLISGSIWASTTVLTLTGAYWDQASERQECILLAGVVIFLVPLVARHAGHADFPSVYRALGLIVAFSALLWLASDGASSSFFNWPGRAVEHTYEVLGWIATIAAIWLGIRREWRGMVNISAVFFAMFLFLRLHRWWWDWMPRYLFFLVVGLVAILLVAIFQRLRGRLREVRV